VGGYDHSSPGPENQEEHRVHVQRFSLYEDLTVEENIDFFSGIYNVPQARKQARKHGHWTWQGSAIAGTP